VLSRKLGHEIDLLRIGCVTVRRETEAAGWDSEAMEAASAWVVEAASAVEVWVVEVPVTMVGVTPATLATPGRRSRRPVCNTSEKSGVVVRRYSGPKSGY
jgi:hypothetical protein